MSVAEQFPARTGEDGRTWWRPVRAPGTDFSQWGWTSDPAQAHPDYDALDTCTCPWVDPSLWTTHYGAVEPGSTREHNPHCPVHPVAAVASAPTHCPDCDVDPWHMGPCLRQRSDDRHDVIAQPPPPPGSQLVEAQGALW